ncbi:unnamed protein product, partial [Ectocarpus sp. 12 AP-2014]
SCLAGLFSFFFVVRMAVVLNFCATVNKMRRGSGRGAGQGMKNGETKHWSGVGLGQRLPIHRNRQRFNRRSGVADKLSHQRPHRSAKKGNKDRGHTVQAALIIFLTIGGKLLHEGRTGN